MHIKSSMSEDNTASAMNSTMKNFARALPENILFSPAPRFMRLSLGAIEPGSNTTSQARQLLQTQWIANRDQRAVKICSLLIGPN